MDLITVWEPEPWASPGTFVQVLRDALIFLARSQNEHLAAVVFDQYDQTDVVHLRMRPDDRLGWLKPNLITIISDSRLTQGNLQYDEEDARQLLYAQGFSYERGAECWYSFEPDARICEAEDCAEALMVVLSDLFEAQWQAREVQFILPTIHGHSAYTVRRPSDGHKYATDKERYEREQFLLEARALARSDLDD